MSFEVLIITFYSYILGSIPFGLILTKFFLNEDLKNIGSGNIGATNVLRTGKKSLDCIIKFTFLMKLFKSFSINKIFSFKNLSILSYGKLFDTFSNNFSFL